MPSGVQGCTCRCQSAAAANERIRAFLRSRTGPWTEHDQRTYSRLLSAWVEAVARDERTAAA